MPEAARAARDDAVRGHHDFVPASPADAPRRTVTITGRPDGPPPSSRHLRVVPARPNASVPPLARRLVQIDRRRPPRRAHERLGSQPDRLAMWAVMMALFLIIIVATSSHG